ncbi:C-type lectin-like [Elysia marginata]|uniref:C-type lectin-like n=1 Tax=Elysia marginata TaxID=1093978 RepID=A0AAV4JLL8_9GAST|nr:C-type lectin-like [Elysia marginata]
MFGCAHEYLYMVIMTILFVKVQCGPVPGPAMHLSFGTSPGRGGQVRSNTVSCTLDASLTNLDKVTVLTLYGSKAYGQAGEFDSLATIDLWSPQARLLNTLDAAAGVEAFGQINNVDVKNSQLTISWGYPPVTCPRQYKCVANGLDREGRVMTMSIEKDTKLSPTTITDLQVNENQTSTELDTFKTGLQNLSSDVAALKQTVSSLGSLIQNQTSGIQHFEERVLSELKNLKLASALGKFDFSGVFEGKFYFVSKTAATFDIGAADFQCQVMGGRLLEMESKKEYDFVFNFVKGLGGDNFFTGGNDIHKEGEWTFWHSGRPVTFANWHRGQPNNSGNNEDCLEIRISFAASNDLGCNAQAKFVCEAPA